MSKICQCEHASHFDHQKNTPKGRQAHPYAARFSPLLEVEVKTPYGRFRVCRGCADDCLEQYRKEEQ